jgi:hypothetical protein
LRIGLHIDEIGQLTIPVLQATEKPALACENRITAMIVARPVCLRNIRLG